MTSKKSNGSRKDPLKTPKVWERARREKMKIYFNELQEILPFYDPSAPMSRFEILQKSKVYIKDLQDQNQDLLNGGFDEVYKIKMMKLKQRVKELLKRVDQLTDLLRTANIMIPPLETYPEGVKNPPTFKWMSQQPKKWTEKINLVVPDEKIKSVLTLIKDYKKNASKVKLKKKQSDKSSEKSENRTVSDSHLQKPVAKKKKLSKKCSKVINLKSKETEKSDSFPGSQSPSQFKENQPVDFNLLSNETTISKTVSTEQSSSVPVVTGKVIGGNTNSEIALPATCLSGVTIPQNVILPSVPNVLQSNTFILTNDGSLLQLPILNSPGTVLSANSNLLTPAAVVKPTAGLLTPLVINKPSPLIVLQKPAPQIIQTAQIINPTPQVITVSKPSVQILGSTNMYTSSSSITTGKALPHILSKAPTNKKRIARDSTVTTYVNKIPIPALSKQSYAKKSVPVSAVNSKEKPDNAKSKDNLEEAAEKETGNEKEVGAEDKTQNENTSEMVERESPEKSAEQETPAEGPQKRGLAEEREEGNKKQKLDEENVFKPIENEADGVFCNLALPNSINPSLSVSPTAAFLSSFPIVAPSRSEAEEEIAEKKADDGKNQKGNDSALEKGKEGNEKPGVDISKGCLPEVPSDAKDKVNEQPLEQMKLLPDTGASKNNLTQQLDHCKSWDHFHHENCDIRPEAFYIPTDNSIQINNSVAAVDTASATAISFSGTENILTNSYKNYGNVKTNNISIQNSLNEQVNLKNNHFEYPQKENYVSKVAAYTERPPLTKTCSSNMADSYGVAGKSQPTGYQIDPTPNYQLLMPSKEVSNQRNSRTVNWMTEPDIPNRGGLMYGTQNDKMTAAKTYNPSDNFYMNPQNAKISSDCSAHYMTNDQNKMNYQKNDFYGKDQRCKPMEKRTDPKCYGKNSQNSYNIFDYNYATNCFGEDTTGKYCQAQPSYPGKTKKSIPQPKKKSDDVHQVSNDLQSNEPIKRPSDQIIGNLDFPVTNQECFTWMPGKNVEWLPSKSFGLDTNLVVPSTLPTLVGDLALGTTSTTDTSQPKPMNAKGCQSNLKANTNDVAKDYMDLGMAGSATLPKPMENVDTSKQYFEPFTNLSKNIFDVTPSNMNNAQMSKNDFDKINFIGNNSNETIVLKNIFELPVSKSSESDFSRNKQRTITNPQNTFFSVSQLVEPPTFEGNNMKNENQMDSAAGKGDPYVQNYPTYNNNSNNNNNNQKTYKNKTRSSHCKYNDRKFQGYKNGASSSYTAEALIRSNTQVNYQANDFSADVNTNFFNAKPNQKPDQFPGNNKIDFEINMKTDFSGGPGQNIYSDFNFSSPVPNFTIAPTVGTEFGNHDPGGNFSAQNNSFFGDFITPEYPLTDNVSNSLLLPPCSIALQNPFVIEKRNAPAEKTKNNSKQYSGSRNRKHYDCSKTSFNEFSIPPSSAIFTTSSITCPTIFTTSACQNLLPVPTQSIPITFSSPSFTTSTISFPPLSTANNNYHRFPNASTQNSASGSFLTSNSMFTTCTSKPPPSSHSYSSNPLTSVTNSVISSFPVANVPFSGTSQSSIPFFSLSNPIIPSSAPTSSSNSLANFNLSTIFPEINQKGNYHYS